MFSCVELFSPDIMELPIFPIVLVRSEGHNEHRHTNLNIASVGHINAVTCQSHWTSAKLAFNV